MAEADRKNTSYDGRLPSYRTRYFQIVLALAIAFAVVAILAQRYVATISRSHAAEAEFREQGIVLLNDAFAQLYRSRQDLHDYLLSPTEPSVRAKLDAALQLLNSALARLLEHAANSPTGDVAAISRSLREDGRTLGDRIRELIEIRRDPALWLPASSIIEDQLQTANTMFTGDLDALLAALGSPSDPVSVQRMIILYRLQKAWLRMVDELRLIIANRFGAHSVDPIAGMQARSRNVETYMTEVEALLTELRSGVLNPDGDPVFAAEIDVLAAHFAEYRKDYAALIAELSGPGWRHDLEFLRNRVDPQLRVMQRRLEILRLELQAQSIRQVETLTGISTRLGNVLFAALGLMLLIGMSGYFSLDRLILRPIRTLAKSLKAHSTTGHSSSPPPPMVSETRDLLNAFADMQAKVEERERELDHLAHHDALTGLPNRSLFRRRLAEAITVSQRHQMPVGVLFMDLDRFKQVNDSYGHAAGDAILVEIAKRLRKVFRQEDVIARLGGDEFAILLENLHQRDEMTNLAEKALSIIQRPYEFAGRMFYSGASIGIAVAPDDGTDPDLLIQQADAAMYAAKQDEGSSYRFVSAQLTADAAAQHALENELREAIRRQQLELHYQPVLATGDGHLHCYEALLRWPHQEQGMLQPAAFMDALADAGLCSTISDWALDEIQSKRPSGDAAVSINLSARLLHDEAFADRLFERIDVGRLVPERLILEITEDTLETDLRAAARVLHELKRRGVRIALDDFGTGQASLGHLRRFPFDYLKIDQSFVAGISIAPNDEKLIQAIIRLAHALGIEVVAEGVETEAQRAFLDREGCDYVQGYLIGRPSASG